MNTELRIAYDAAIEYSAHLRGSTVTAFAKTIADSVFSACTSAMHDYATALAQYRVVPAPTGSGKSTCALAFTKALIKTAPGSSILYLVETRLHADEVYKDLKRLIGSDRVAVWTAAHDADLSPDTAFKEYGFRPSRQFSVNELKGYPVLVITQHFYTQHRAAKLTEYRDQSRTLTFFDERPNAVSIFDVDTGLIKTVRDRLAEQNTSASDVVPRLTLLHDHLERIWRSAESKSHFDILPADPSLDLGWFATPYTAKYLSSPDEQTKAVFGFARALANGFTFLGRYHAIGKGARFIGYEMKVPPVPGMVILDATADIDGLSLIAKNRQVVSVPQVDFSNLSITHIDPTPLRSEGKKSLLKLRDVLTKAALARPYADWIMETVRHHTLPGEKVLVVAHKGLFDHDYLPANDRFEEPYDLEGRSVCFTHWGKGIGSNEWRDATAVFLFGEFHKPKRTTVASGLGWGEERASLTTLLPYQPWNDKGSKFVALKDGDLCRWMKQMAMRGSARKIDANGVCGVQRLYVTGELERLVCHAEIMFPGASIDVDQVEKRFQRGGMDALVALLLSSDDDFLSTADIKQLTGVDMQRNGSRVRTKPEIAAAARFGGWDPMPGCGGRGNMGGFIRGQPNKHQPATTSLRDVLPDLEEISE